jgi:regulator of nucleoside diphosphate kinase
MADAQAQLPERVFITRKDYDDLVRLVPASAESDAPARRLLRAKLRRAIVCGPGALPRGVITINSRIAYRREPRGDLKTCILVHPDLLPRLQDAVPATAALGAILLGLPEGCAIRQQGPYGSVFFLRIESVEQPPSPSTP